MGIRSLSRWVAAVAALCVVATGWATPQFAREFDRACSACHSHVPKLNEFGERFLANGYRIPDEKRRSSIPVAVWSSLLRQNFADEADRFKAIPNRIELISAGGSPDGRVSYFAEWRVLSREFLSDMSVRDRSGRFEDLYVTLGTPGETQFQIGQFRALSQIDVSRRLHLAEPSAFSTSLPGEPDSDPRITSLRGFSLSGRAPSLRIAAPLGEWTGVGTVPFPGEFSIPLTDEARTTASFELESEPKGVLVEFYRRRGTDSAGLHAFVGNNDRRLIGAALQQRFGEAWLEGGIVRAETGSAKEWRYSVGLDWIPTDRFAGGVRVDHRQIAAQKPVVLPYVSLLQPFGRQAAKLVAEGRFQDGRTPRWVLELGWMF